MNIFTWWIANECPSDFKFVADDNNEYLINIVDIAEIVITHNSKEFTYNDFDSIQKKYKIVNIMIK